MRVLAAEPEDLVWIRHRAGSVFTPLATAIKAVDESGAIRGMVAYDSFTPNSCQAHMAVDSPIVWRSLIPVAFAYPFNQLGLGVLYGVVLSSNDKSDALTRHLGFKEVTRLKDGWSVGTDLIVFELRREDASRWLPEQRQGKAA